MLRLTNTLTGAKEPIEPLEPGRVAMYSCGPTVYRPVHIGNLRTFMLADLIARTLSYEGLEVCSVMNITDVGHMTDEVTESGRDRMLLAADDEGLDASQIAQKYTDAFFEDIAVVGVRPADVYPRASDHIPQIVDLVAKLVERGHAYEVDGDVFYDVTTFSTYGRLSGQSLGDMQAGHRSGGVDARKRHHQDFSLWVSAGPRRELVFDSPWGPGYPGWHIECSAMSLHHLGERFDIHTAGVDLRFPHHENEIAQSEGAVGHEVVSTWAHGEHLLMGQAKMAKSAGNALTMSDVVAEGHDPLAFRYLTFTARYRRQVHFTEEALGAAGTALRRLREQVTALEIPATPATTDHELRAGLEDRDAVAYHDRFLDAIDDDLDLPEAVALLHRLVTDRRLSPALRGRIVASWDHVLGLDLVAGDGLTPQMQDLIAERERAREAGDYERADEIRDRVRGEGIELLDRPDGTRWIRRRGGRPTGSAG